MRRGIANKLYEQLASEPLDERHLRWAGAETA
jgi:hypothetical protein